MKNRNEPHQTIELPHGVYNQLDINPYEERVQEQPPDDPMEMEISSSGFASLIAFTCDATAQEKITQGTQTFSVNEGSPDPVTSTQH